MLAQATQELVNETFAERTQPATSGSIHDGLGTSLFTSGLAPESSSDALLGDATEMFTSGL